MYEERPNRGLVANITSRRPVANKRPPTLQLSSLKQGQVNIPQANAHSRKVRALMNWNCGIAVENTKRQTESGGDAGK